MNDKYDISGRRFGSWVAIERDESRGKNAAWICACDCGTKSSVFRNNLVRGLSRMCRACVAKLPPGNKKHGMSESDTFRIWSGMIQRCTNPNVRCFKGYGGRGISVCERWLNSFENFLIDMGGRPSKEHSIDRIDVNGNYEKSNCKWSTRSEQARNRRTTARMTMNGKRVALADVLEAHGIPRETYYSRIKKGIPAGIASTVRFLGDAA